MFTGFILFPLEFPWKRFIWCQKEQLECDTKLPEGLVKFKVNPRCTASSSDVTLVVVYGAGLVPALHRIVLT